MTFNNLTPDQMEAQLLRQAEIIGKLRAALTQIACFDDEGANKKLAARGSYTSFDEPGSVMIARRVLKDYEH